MWDFCVSILRGFLRLLKYQQEEFNPKPGLFMAHHSINMAVESPAEEIRKIQVEGEGSTDSPSRVPPSDDRRLKIFTTLLDTNNPPKLKYMA